MRRDNPIVIPFQGKAPVIGKNVYIAPNAAIIGDVVIGDHSSIWFGATVRGDYGPIRIGERCSVQDSATVHVFHDDTGPVPTEVGHDVTVGHGAVIEGCVVGDGVLIGANAVLLPGVSVGKGSIVAAAALVKGGEQIPPATLVAGVPARLIGPVSEESSSLARFSAAEYVALQAIYRAEQTKRAERDGSSVAGGRSG